MCLWDWYFYHSCLHIDGKIKYYILRNLRDTLERTLKVITGADQGGVDGVASQPPPPLSRWKKIKKVGFPQTNHGK